MTYIDGMMCAVASDKQEAYLAHTKSIAAVFKEHGALKVVDCWGDQVPAGKLTSMPMAVQCQEGETVVFGWITWPSKEVRDAGWEKVMQDPRMSPEVNPMPFDGKRMIFGGFEVISEI